MFCTYAMILADSAVHSMWLDKVYRSYPLMYTVVR